ncbi:hypothetical protein HanRHA438_Chr04g0178651 [Helianthus annuus]|nr:hypothetical protein HanRHA438_Chr04g0178651 [Helianthus annuus]
METEEDIALYYYVSQQESYFETEKEPVFEKSISREPVSIKKDSEIVLDKTEKGLEVDSEKAENISEVVSEKAPVFDHSSDEESDDDIRELEKLEFYKRLFLSEMFNKSFAEQIEKLKNKLAAKKENQKAANVEEIIESEKNQVISAHQEKPKLDESTELSQNGEVKEQSSSTNETSGSEPVYSEAKIEEEVRIVEEQVKEILAFKIENEADDKKDS